MTDQSTAALDEAAAEAVKEQSEETEVVEEQTQEEPDEASAEESAEDEGLPTEHKERSDLGRKVSAMHRRMDEFDNKFDRLLSAFETKTVERDESQSVDPDEPLTYRDWERLSAEQKAREQREQKKYDDKYRRTVQGLGTDLTDSEWQDVVSEMGKMPLNPSGNPEFDAERNFLKAERAILRKKLAKPVERKNPLKGEDKPPSVTTSQKSVVKEAAEPKLSPDAQSYLRMVEREDGEERAANLKKAL